MNRAVELSNLDQPHTRVGSRGIEWDWVGSSGLSGVEWVCDLCYGVGGGPIIRSIRNGGWGWGGGKTSQPG